MGHGQMPLLSGVITNGGRKENMKIKYSDVSSSIGVRYIETPISK